MEQTERDILIEVKTKVELLTETVNSMVKKMDSVSNDYDNLRSRIDKLEPAVKENKDFRKWIWTSLITSLIGIISWLMNLIVNKL